MASGVATLDFGAFPGVMEAAVVITGQAAILATSLVEAWRMPTVATADKTTDEQKVESLRVLADTISVGVGFTIRGFEDSPPAWKDINHGLPAPGAQRQRLHGQYTIGWAWT